MCNLFIKDFYLVRKHLWIALFYSFMIFFLFSTMAAAAEVQGMVYSIGTAMIGYTMIMYTTAYDDKNNSEVLLNSLPISRSKIVIARYLSILAFALIGILSMAVSGLILKNLNLFNITGMITFADLIGAISGVCIISFLYLPVFFKFGYVKAKMFNLVLFAIGFAGPMLIAGLLKGIEKPLWLDNFIYNLNNQPDSVMGLLIFLILIILLGLGSLAFSIVVYKRREF